MKLQITTNPRVNEPVGFLLLIAAVGLALSLVSFYPLDPSLNVARDGAAARNLVGVPGAYFSDLALQWFGLAAFLAPFYCAVWGWFWLRSTEVPWIRARLAGAILLPLVACAALGLTTDWRVFGGVVRAGGVLGTIFAEVLVRYLNRPGAVLLLVSCAVLSLYLLTSFRLERGAEWMRARGSNRGAFSERWRAWRLRLREKGEERRARREERKREKEETRSVRSSAYAAVDDEEVAAPILPPLRRRATLPIEEDGEEAVDELPPIVPYDGAAPYDPAAEPDDIAPAPTLERQAEQSDLAWDDEEDFEEEPENEIAYRVPSTQLLQPPAERSSYDPDELHETARTICSKFEEFKVGGSVSQINPGPVVTTFEFKPDAGVKYSKIINLSEDLCLALECESILVERIPGKSTVGIEVPNRRREIIGMREIIESKDFRSSDSPLTVALGKDINGRLKVADLTSMPHLLVAGSTGSGKSVLINTIIMSIILRSSPKQVRFIMVDPKTVELGVYQDIPHLLTPVITDMKKASNALKNATHEMERRLKLLAEHGVRNIDQFNNKLDRIRARVEEKNPELAASLTELPYIVLIIDELADLMMLEGRQIEESITRLAQMARAVGIHLLLATQRPSVDVITGLIKANIPARISFRLATRVDSRTILDTMGAEALLGRGDMLFLPPGTSRMMRVHGPLVTEEEIEAVVREWKAQGRPRYETEYLEAPAGENEEGSEASPGLDDPSYNEAVQLVLQMGKASTSTLQRRLRLGYGRAARLLDAMEQEGIIGPPDGSRPRDVLKRPDWLDGYPSS